MGRVKRPYPKGRCRLHTPKNVEPDKLYPIQYEYTWNGSTIRYDSTIKAKTKDWNPKGNSGRGELRSSFGVNYTIYNRQLSDNLDRVDVELMKYGEKHPGQITSEIVRAILRGEPKTRKDEGRDFYDYVISILKEKLATNHISRSRYENNVSNMKIFREFLASQGKGTYKTDGIYLGQVSKELIVQYIDYRRNIKNNVDATINHSLTPIIVACNRAKEWGLIEPQVANEIKECRIHEIPSLDDEKWDRKFLTREQLNKLVEFYNADTEPRRKEYIEMFLFAFHAGGMRLVDVATLTWNHVHFSERTLRKILVKTAKRTNPRHTVPLTPPAIKILRKWEQKRANKQYVFDLLPDDVVSDDMEELYYRRNSCDKKVNQSLHIVGEKIGLPFPLNFHAARHTFAILALNDGMDLSTVSRLLGHSSTSVTERVYAAYLPTKLSDEIERLNYNFLPDGY